jgi:uncharacterized protein (DUF779 family)
MARRVPTVYATPEARDALRRLHQSTGSLVVMQSAGCCDGSAPMVLPARDLPLATTDVRIGAVEGVPVYISGRELDAWEHGDLELDVEPGYADGFSLAPGDGQHFVSRSRPAPNRSAVP